MPTIASPPPEGFDRARGARAARAHLEHLVGIDTQNPPGNELLAARYLDGVFATMRGVERHVLEAAPGRANFVARLRAERPAGRPLLVMGHTDVVGADAASWQSDPFTASVREGYLYGRGAIDDKGMLATALAAIEQLAMRRDLLSRDIVFLATAGEEGGPRIGIDEMVTTHRALLGDAEFALNEGGRVRLDGDVVRTVTIQTTEKVPYRVTATATGPTGHASVPRPDNALAALARAVARVHEWRAPVMLNETTRLYFSRLAAIERDAGLRAAMTVLARPEATPAELDAAAGTVAANPAHDAVLRTGQSLTLLDGGFRSNVIPSTGRATFDLRVLPGHDVRDVVAAMQAAAGEPQVRFALEGEPRESAPPSPTTSPLYQALERAAAQMAPEATAMPFMSTGATDGAVLRAVGIPTYGILPFPLTPDDERRMHGHDERVGLDALGWGVEYLYRAITALEPGAAGG